MTFLLIVPPLKLESMELTCFKGYYAIDSNLRGAIISKGRTLLVMAKNIRQSFTILMR